jgi:hypothetical protein
MMKLFRRFVKKRKYTIVAVPFLFAFLAHAGLSALPTHALIVKADDTAFVTHGQESTLSLRLEAETPINVVGGVVTYPTDILKVTEITTDESLINLWARKPSYSNELGIINFGGGIVEKGGFIGGGNVFTVHFEALAVGVADIQLEGAVMLAQDGAGTNVLSDERNERIYVREPALPSPDVNEDGALTLADINSVYLQTFNDYDPRFDINGDGDTTLSDVSSLISLF